MSPRETTAARTPDRPPQAAAPASRAQPRWLAPAIFLGICVLALAVRLLYLAQARQVPFFEHLLVDSRRYAEWGREIAAGDWLGEGVFFQAPLYPYFLGLFFKLSGPELNRLYLGQMVLGAISCGLLFLAGRSFVSLGVGAAAGLLLAFYGPAVFFDGLVQKTVLATFLLVLLLWLMGLSLRRRHGLIWCAMGVALGLLSLTRENARLLVVVLAVWAALHFGAHSRRARAGWILALLLGLGAVLLPVAVRNYAVGGEFVLTTSQMGANFYIGNNPLSHGFYVPLVPGQHHPDREQENAQALAERALGRELSPGEVSAYWMGRAWDYIRNRPGSWARLMLTKCGLLWNAYEVPDANDFYFYQEFSWVLKGLGRVNHFGVLCPLAVAGLILTWGRRRQLWVLYALLLAVAGATVAFFIFARYRFPLVPILCIFAAAGLVEGGRFIRRGGLRLAVVLGIVVCAAVFCNWAVPEADGMRALSYANLGDVLQRQGKPAEAVEQYRRGLSLVPDDAQGHFDVGTVLMKLQRYDEAVAHFRTAAEVDPGFVQAHNRWGVALGMQGRFPEAVDCFRRALQVQPDHFDSLNDLGFVLANLGRLQEAERAYRRARVLNPISEQTVANLYQVYVVQEKYTGAI